MYEQILLKYPVFSKVFICSVLKESACSSALTVRVAFRSLWCSGMVWSFRTGDIAPLCDYERHL